jgi:hypothetical protein
MASAASLWSGQGACDLMACCAANRGGPMASCRRKVQLQVIGLMCGERCGVGSDVRANCRLQAFNHSGGITAICAVNA